MSSLSHSFYLNLTMYILYNNVHTQYPVVIKTFNFYLFRLFILMDKMNCELLPLNYQIV